MNFLLVFIGGGLGSIARYSVGLWMAPWAAKFPFATLIANGAACLVLGFVVGLLMAGNLSDQRRLLLATGFCGGFSTFSTFTSETFFLWQNREVGAALLNVALNLVVSFLCLILGLKLSV